MRVYPCGISLMVRSFAGLGRTSFFLGIPDAQDANCPLPTSCLLNAVYYIRTQQKLTRTMKTGVISLYNATKGYGFTERRWQPGNEIFRCGGLVDKNINQGDMVSFDVVQGRKGPNGINIKI